MVRMTIRLLWVTLTLCALAFIFFLILSFTGFSPRLFELSYRAGWSFDNGLLMLIKYFPALQFSAILICYSLFNKPALSDTEAQSGPFYRLVMFSLILFLVSTMGGFLLEEIAAPGAEARQYRRMEETRITRELTELAEMTERKGETEEALELYRRLLIINPHETEALEIKLEQLENKVSSENTGEKHSAGFSRMTDRSPRELLDTALGYERKEDFFSAYYYASLAFQIDDQFYEAREAATRIWARIENLAPMREELERTYIFNRKKEGVELLTGGKGTDAYYLFLSLKNYLKENRLPPDPDVNQYLETAGLLCLESSFFKEDIYTLMITPGYANLVFRNMDTVNGREYTEIVSLGRAVPHIPSRGIWMAEDIRVIRYSDTGTEYSLSAPYGKIIFGTADDSRGRLIMSGIDPSDRNSDLHATYHSGKSSLELENILPLYIGAKELEALAENSIDYSMANLMWLWDTKDILENAGYSPDDVYMTIFRKVLYPFSFIIFCLLSVTFGWRTRQRNGGPVPGTFVLFPFLPYLVHKLYELYTAANVSVLSFIRDLGGFIPAFTALIIIQGLLLIFSFILLAGQRSSLE